MEPRKLKTLLRTLTEFGVTSYRDAGVTLQLGAPSPPVPEGDVEGQLELPMGVPDAAAALARVRAAYAPQKGRAS